MTGICVENIADIVLWLQGQKAVLGIGYPGRFIGASLYLILKSWEHYFQLWSDYRPGDI